MILQCKKISKSYTGGSYLFNNISFSVNKGEHIGIIGKNGSGKSTLLKILASLVDVDEGEVISQKALTFTYVEQEAVFDENISVYSYLVKKAKEHINDDTRAEFLANKIISKMELKGANNRIDSLSGGWKKRLSIACALLTNPEVILLDEPTNHLDWEGLMWLKNFLKSTKNTWLVVSHDRYILDSCPSKIIELNKKFTNGIFISDATYREHVILSQQITASLLSQKDILANKLRKEKSWLNSGTKARTTKAKFRIDNVGHLTEKYENIKEKSKEDALSIGFTHSSRKTKKLVSFDAVDLSYGKKNIIKDFNFILTSKMKIGIIGSNGVGKSSLLNLINKDICSSSGIVSCADNIKVAYFDQLKESIDKIATVKEILTGGGDYITYQGRNIHIVGWVKRFGFTQEQLHQPSAKLSGGEKAKLFLASIITKEVDIILLDEPTNDLDISTIEIFEKSLQEFQGAVVVVSHDRFFLSNICNSYLGVNKNGSIRPYASVDQCIKDMYLSNSNTSIKNKKTVISHTKKSDNKNKITYKEKFEYENIENKIFIT